MKLRIRHPLIAAGLAGAFASPGLALAQTNVQVYGLLIPFFDNARTNGATAPGTAGASQVGTVGATNANAPSRNRLTVGTSALGFRGSEELGNGLKAIFQIESGIPLDGDPGPNTLASRNSNVGLAGNWGTLFFGNWDTPYKWMALQTGPLRGLTPADYSNILHNPGFRVPGTTTQSGRVNNLADAAFSRRQGNSIQYWTPNVAGFFGRFAYSANEGKTAATAAAPSISPTIYSLSAGYDNGPYTLRYGYEQHKDYFGMAQLGGSAGATNTNTSSKDTGHQVVGMARFGATKLALQWERLKYDNEDSLAGAIKQYKRDAYNFTVQQFFGDSSIWAMYGIGRDGTCQRVGGAACSTSDLGAKQWQVGGSYAFSKRTEAFAIFYGVNNKQFASYGSFPSVPAGAGGNGATAIGADTRAFGAGIQHIF